VLSLTSPANAISERKGTIFFLTHLTTTIGYGHSHPLTAPGQIATVVFALVGLPIMAYVLALVVQVHFRAGNWFAKRLLGVVLNTQRNRLAFLFVLFLSFLFGGAAIYSTLEGWRYSEAVYFCFATLTTVGFGDFLPSSAASRAFSILYMIFGVGVSASVIATLTGLVDRLESSLEKLLPEAGACASCVDREKN